MRPHYACPSRTCGRTYEQSECASKREQSERQATSRRSRGCLRHFFSYAFSIMFMVLWSIDGARASVANSRASVPACDQKERADIGAKRHRLRARATDGSVGVSERGVSHASGVSVRADNGVIATPLKSPCDQRERGRKRAWRKPCERSEHDTENRCESFIFILICIIADMARCMYKKI